MKGKDCYQETRKTWCMGKTLSQMLKLLGSVKTIVNDDEIDDATLI